MPAVGFSFSVARAVRPPILEIELARELAENFRRVIEFHIYFERFRVVRNPGRILDVVNVVAETLQADDVMNVLPNHAGDRAFEPMKPITTIRFDFIEAATSNAQRPTSNVASSELSVER